MSKLFPTLFTRGKIGTLALENRVIKAPMITSLGSPDGSVTDRLIRYYEEAARGGAGLVIVEDTYMDNAASQGRPCQLSVADVYHIPGLSALARAIQDGGARAGLQLGHAGFFKALKSPPIVGPSPIPPEELHLPPGVVPEVLTVAQIREIVAAFGDAARRVQDAGFDFLEIHGGHGYLIAEFLSPKTNLRTDDYGGSREKRFRFLAEIIGDIRGKVGRDFPLSIRLSGTDYEPGGIAIEETVAIVPEIARLGADVIHVSGGNHNQVIRLPSPMSLPPGQHVWAAEAIKKVSPIPVIVSGSITTPELAEEILRDSKADFISMARPLHADPQWPEKARRDRPEEIRPCIRCNDGCLDRSNNVFRFTQCTVNVAVGREESLAITPAPHRRKVAVVGGGPGGAEAALVCARRGHAVTLYEPREIGGALLEASVPEFKADLRRLVKYYVNQLKDLKVKVVRQEADTKALRGGGYEAVIIAAGGSPIVPDVPGINSPMVSGALEVLGGKKTVGQKVVVIGGGMVGTEVGLWLAEQGKEVTFVEMRDEFMCGVGFFDRWVYNDRFAQQKVTVLTGTLLKAISDDGAVVADKDGKTREVAADCVVLAAGFTPRTALKEQLEKVPGLEVRAVGDCVSPRRIYEAIHEGYLAAYRM
ncbi:MAG: FAD-dependent oxidoreductase [Chloroflexota bacterium]